MTRRARFRDTLRTRFGVLLRTISRTWSNPDRQLTTLALLIGTVTGLGAVAFSELVHVVEWLYFEFLAGRLIGGRGDYWVLPLFPVSGALLVGLITVYVAPEAQGHGVPEVMDAMARRGGRIRPRVAGAKALASALTIGSGGSAGTEGPIIQIGAAIGSGFGQWLRVSLSDLRVLIGCGAAAGIASIFNAPIAGVLFAVEVLLRDVSQRSFVPIIISAVLSSTVTQSVRGHNEAIFPTPSVLKGYSVGPVYEFDVEELANYALLGVVCGIVAIAMIRVLYLVEDLFERLPVHRLVRPAIGALLLAGLAIAEHSFLRDRLPLDPRSHLPAIMGNGYPVIARALDPTTYASSQPSWTIAALLVLLVAKVFATSFTLGSGGSGGVFAPSLFIGATAGGAFGLAAHATGWFPGLTPGAYALVGMAAVVGATMHAPLTATLMLFELTRDYKVIIPIMLAVVIAIGVATRFETASIYTLKLLRRGVRFAAGDLRLLQRISVRDIPRIPAVVVGPEDPVDRLVQLMRTSAVNDFVVCDDGRLRGMVLGDDLRTMLLETEAMPLLTVSDIVRTEVPTVSLDETLDVVLDKFAGEPMQSLPVIDPAAPDQIGELVTRHAVMNRYHQSIANPATG